MRDDFNDSGRKYVQPAGELEIQLVKAAEGGDAKEVETLIKKGANVFVASEKPLLLAAQNGHLDVVKLLVAEGSLGISRYTAPTFKAQANGHTDVANYLKQALDARRYAQWNKPPTP